MLGQPKVANFTVAIGFWIYVGRTDFAIGQRRGASWVGQCQRRYNFGLVPYDNAFVDVNGTLMGSVSGGTRWGGGLWMDSLDHARFGLLISRDGNWNGKQIISSQWIEQATRAQGVNPEYGYLWWLNTTGRWPAAPKTCFSAQGAGDNSIWIDREHDLVVVWRWHKGAEVPAEFYKRILQALTDVRSSAH